MTDSRIARADPYHLIFSLRATMQHYADFEGQVRAVLGPGHEGEGLFEDAARFLEQLYLNGMAPVPPKKLTGRTDCSARPLFSLIPRDVFSNTNRHMLSRTGDGAGRRELLPGGKRLVDGLEWLAGNEFSASGRCPRHAFAPHHIAARKRIARQA